MLEACYKSGNAPCATAMALGWLTEAQELWSYIEVFLRRVRLLYMCTIHTGE